MKIFSLTKKALLVGFLLSVGSMSVLAQLTPAQESAKQTQKIIDQNVANETDTPPPTTTSTTPIPQTDKNNCAIRGWYRGADNLCHDNQAAYETSKDAKDNLDCKWPFDKDKKCCSSSKIYYNTESNKDVCCNGILLNTNVPFIGQCITFSKEGNQDEIDNWTVVTETNAFPVLMSGLTKIMVTVILLVCFVAILAGGVMISASGGSSSGAGKGKELIGKVVVAIALLGASGVILRLINPNFFG